MRHFIRAILSFAFVLLIALLAVASRPDQTQETPGNQGDASNSVSVLAKPQAPDSVSNQSESNAKFREYIYKWIQPETVVGIVLAIFAAVGIRTAVATLKQLRKQTSANMIAAEAAKKSADFILLTERAFLSVNNWRLVAQKPRPMAFIATMDNTGRTP